MISSMNTKQVWISFKMIKSIFWSISVVIQHIIDWMFFTKPANIAMVGMPNHNRNICEGLYYCSARSDLLQNKWSSETPIALASSYYSRSASYITTVEQHLVQRKNLRQQKSLEAMNMVSVCLYESFCKGW